MFEIKEDGNKLLSKGVYIIVNKKLKIAYIGMTTKSFLIRLIQHLYSDKTWNNEQRVKLILDDSTEFKILKHIEYRGSCSLYLWIEKYYTNKYREQGYEVLNTVNKCLTPFEVLVKRYNESDIVFNEEKLRNDYKKCFIKMSYALAKKNNINVSEIYKWSYKDISKKFNSNVYNREGKTIVDKLELKELESIIYIY